jgi:hypothetical protein
MSTFRGRRPRPPVGATTLINPWMVPLAMSSANVIALRTMMLWPVDGRPDAWQRRESVRMVGEKLEAMRESQAQAMSLAWRMWFAPWSVWTPGDRGSVQRSVNRATASVVAPFSRRANANARRLQARAMAPVLEAMTAPARAMAEAAAAGAAGGRRRRAR